MIKGSKLGHYWKTSNKSPDTWVEDAVLLLDKYGAHIHAYGFAYMAGESIYQISFSINSESYMIQQPVLPHDKSEITAARRQAATLLYHDIKSRILYARVHGTLKAFINYHVNEDGYTVNQLLDSGQPLLKG